MKSKNALRLVAGGVLVVGSGGAGGLLAPAGAEDTSTLTTDSSTTSTTDAAISPSSFVPLANYSVLNTNDAGAGSLRQAVLDANANAGADTITFDPSVTGTITLTSGQIDITDSVTITGPGSATLEISGNDTSRIFNAATSGTDVSISGLSFVQGSGPAWNGQWNDWNATGGAIRVSNASITLDQVSMSDNASNRLGGGLGTYNARVSITGSTFSSNTAAAGGGGMSFYGGASVTLDRVTVSGNTVSGMNGGTATQYNYGGGGLRVASSSSATITASTFSSNAVVNAAHQNGAGGAIYAGAWSGPVVIEGVLIDSNTNNRDGSGFASFGSVTIANSTITGNSLTAPSGTYGGAVRLAGLWSGTTRSKVLQTTITGNISNGTNPSGLVSLNRAGRSTDLTVSLYGTVVAGNTGGPDVGFPDSWGPSGGNVPFPATTDFMITSANSVIGSVRAATPFTDNGGNQMDVTDPMLAPLANNGGPTRTMAPLPGSPLLNAGGSTVPTFVGNAYDQRGAGFARLSGWSLDVGAFEVQIPAPTLTAVSPASGPLAGGSTITLTGTNFTNDMTVMVGGVACTTISVLSSTSATCVTPAGSAGAVNVELNNGTAAATLPNSFTYEEPVPTTTSTSTTAGEDTVVPAFTG